MKYLLLSVLILACLQADARHKKAPPTEFSEEPVNEPDKDLVSAGIRSYRQADFRSGYGQTLDTSRLYIFRFDAQGRLEDSKEYEYATDGEPEKQQVPFDKIRTRIYKGSQISYRYDAGGNVTSMKTYGVLVAGTEEAATYALIEKYRDQQPYGGNGGRITDEARQQANLKRFVDSFLRANREDKLLLTEEHNYTYDADGNILTQEQPSEKKYTSFTYKYDDAGRVIVKRSVYRFTGDGGNMPYYSGYEVHYTYTADGKPASVSIYSAERDTGDIAKSQYLVRQYSTHYNEAGDPDTVSNLLRHGRLEKQITTYNGHLRTAFITLNGNGAGAGNDTASFTTFKYEGANPAETITISYANGKRAGRTREITAYNGRNLLVEHTKYEEGMSDYSPANEVEQSLFFYGNAAEDKQTALRHGREEAVVRARRQERIRTEREDWERSKAREKQQQHPDLATDPGLKTAAPAPPPQNSEDPVLRFVEQMPRFDGDLNAFMSANLHYPAVARKDSVEGRVAVQFVIRRDGSVTDVTVVRPAGHGMDEEAVKLIQRMPKWIPGRQQGRPVSVFFTLPVTFRLKQQ